MYVCRPFTWEGRDLTLITPPLFMLGNGAYIFSSTGLDDILLGINAQRRRSMRSQR